MKGLVPYPNSVSDNRFPHSLEFFYIGLNEVLTGQLPGGDYVFDWSAVEAGLEAAKARGNQSVFRIFSEYPGQGISIPQFLVDGGVTVTELAYGDKNAFTPDYENASLRAAFQATIADLGAEYDGDERVAFLELGLLGVWGEWHNFGNDAYDASATVRGELLQAYQTAFSDTKLLTRYPRGAGDGAAANFNLPFGYHDDSYTYTTLGPINWHFWPRVVAAGAQEKWKTQAVGGELFPELNGCVFEDVCAHDGKIATDFIETVETTHASYMRLEGVFQSGLSEQRRTRAEAAVRRMAYDLHFDEATITPAGSDLAVTAVLENRGVAPFYYNWPITVALLDAAGAMIQEWPVAWQIDGLLPGDERTFSGTFTPAVAAPAGAQVALRVANPMVGGRPVRFSNFSQQVEGDAWMILGGADGAAPVGAPPKVLFIRGGVGTVGFVEGGSDEQGADAFDYRTENGNHSWGELNSVLVAEGFEVEQLAENPVVGLVPTPVPLDTLNLDLYSVIVFGSNNAEYTTAQIDAFMDYIEDGGSAVFVSDANFGQDWGDAPSSDQQFLSRFGMTMNQDNGTYGVRRTDEFVVPNHPILNGVDEFDGEGVSPITRGTPPAGVTSTLITGARFNVGRNTGAAKGPEEPAGATDGTLVVASFGMGRVAGHFDRNTFFNENGAGTNINRKDNEVYTRNLFNWLAGNSTVTTNFAPRGHFPNLLPGTTVLEGTSFATEVVAKDPDGAVASVALTVDGTLIATDTTAPYEFQVPGMLPGNRALTATVTDDLGATTEVVLGLAVIDGADLEQALDRTSWVLSSSINEVELGNAIDGDLTSRWATRNQVQEAGQKFGIDFGQREIFKRIVLETPGNASDYPRAYTVRGSDDGVNFTDIISGVGDNETTEITFAEPVTYRYVEIEQTSNPGIGNWWSIDEINIFQPAGGDTLPLGSWLQFYYGDTPPILLSDDDGDGLTLLEEYAYNTDPFAASGGPSVTTEIDPSDQGQFVDLTFRRWKIAATSGVDYEVQASGDLIAWDSTGLDLRFPFAPTSNGDGTETVIARVKFAQSVERGFVRLQLAEK